MISYKFWYCILKRAIILNSYNYQIYNIIISTWEHGTDDGTGYGEHTHTWDDFSLMVSKHTEAFIKKFNYSSTRTTFNLSKYMKDLKSIQRLDSIYNSKILYFEFRLFLNHNLLTRTMELRYSYIYSITNWIMISSPLFLRKSYSI